MADSQRKTANLFDKDNTTIYSAYFDASGSWLLSADSKSVKMPCQPNTQYTLSVPNSLTVFRVYESNNSSIEPSSTSPPRATEITRGTNISQYTFTTSSTAQIILFQGSNGAVTEWFNGLMLNSGSTALPYEPYGWVHSLRKLGTATDTITTLPADLYADGTNATVGSVGNMSQTGTPTPSSPIQPQECGDLETTGEHTGQYKIPISSANTTTPVYLGEVESTRQIKQLVLTGNEDWTYSASGNKKRVFVTGFDRAQIATSLCSHFVNADYVSYPDSGKYAVNASSTTQTMIFGVTDMAITSATDWTTYLAQQYANGTPVCVWYVLATPQTAVVNEPLRKIGDYADEVSDITIPTTAGADSFDVLTTLKPSEVSLAYTGWHDTTVKEWDSSEWQ